LFYKIKNYGPLELGKNLNRKTTNCLQKLQEGTLRKLIVLSFISLDGVMQAPGGPEEDSSGSFTLGGWVVPYWDELLETEMSDQMSHQFDLLLGRKTYDIFEAAWPKIDPENIINKTTKYVITHKPIPDNTGIWRNSITINGDVVAKIKELKNTTGTEIQVHGSSNIIQILLNNDLIDEFWLKIFPVTLGKGKRLFAEGTIPETFKLIDSKVSPKGVIVVKYQRGGDLKTGSF
jgi:dihydrofolate reductase